MAHSKRYQTKLKLVDRTKVYGLDEALTLVKHTSIARFDGGVEAHFRLGIDPKKGEQQVRGTVSLPHGTGKTKRVAAFVNAAKVEEATEAGADLVGGKEIIDAIRTSEKLNFDVAVAMPELMKDLAMVAKILGPRGLMPSPKNGTVTQNIGATVRGLKGGLIAFKNDDTANLHQVIGRVSWDVAKLRENTEILIDAVRRAKPSSSKGVYLKSLTLTSTMGPGIRVQLS